MFERINYIVERIDGDYAYLKNEVAYEMFQYSIAD